MSVGVFTADYSSAEFEEIRHNQAIAILNLENEILKVTIVNILEAGGAALHSVFEAGDEPKWKDQSQRNSLLELSDVLHAANRQITGS